MVPARATVVVCGAGVAGLSAAWHLAVRHGVRNPIHGHEGDGEEEQNGGDDKRRDGGGQAGETLGQLREGLEVLVRRTCGVDLLLVGDAFFGGIVFLSSAGEPENFFTALRRLQNRGRSRVIPGHIRMYDGQAFEYALFYLKSLERHVEDARGSSRGEDSILEIPIESCLAPHVEASDFEKEFHRTNLQLIIERNLFSPVA